MNRKRFIALLLVLALVPALFGNAFAAGPKARTLTDADYAPVDALWAELTAVERDAQTQSAQDGPDRALVTAQAVAEAVTASDLYVDGTLQYGPTSVSITDDTAVILEITVKGKGTLPVDVYLDGSIYDSQLISFE